jgi:hypothetical protein
MAARFVTIDYDTPLILPPNLRDWVPAGQLAHFILDAVEEMDLRQIKGNERARAARRIRPGGSWRCGCMAMPPVVSVPGASSQRLRTVCRCG